MSALSKRQQARNEKQLQDLVKTVAGNNICADCHARNPAWASWSLGVFLCMRCAAIHRKLGTHISKVKSLSMDSWSIEQVENMRKVGNVVSNQIYNPENKRPPVPVDADEADGAMERFIRQKYTNNVANGGGKPTTPRSDEGVPPPLPPKNSSKFGLRSAMSLNPLSSRSKKESKHMSATDSQRPSSHGSTGKVSRMFGASVSYDDGDDTEKKLNNLRDMGFPDNQRNAIVLKGVNGNMERAIESLVRLGGDGRTSPIPPPPPPHDPPGLRATKSLTPLSSNTSRTNGAPLGLSTARKPDTGRTSVASSVSTNPFDSMTSQPQPQTAQSTGSLPNNNPYTQSTNPFGVPSQQPDAFTQAFQQLDISASQQTQPLFPNRTGGLTPQTQNPPTYSQPPVPSAPTSPYAYQTTFQNIAYPQPVGMPQQPTGYNPFFQNAAGQLQQQPQQPQQPNLSISTQQQQAIQANNPFARSPTRIASPTTLGQIPEQFQSEFQQASSPSQHAGLNNPFYNSPMQSPTFMMQQQQQQQQLQYQQQMQYGQQGVFQSPTRHDKASIMALYNSMPAMPARSLSSDAIATTQSIANSGSIDQQVTSATAASYQAQAPPPPQLHRSMTQPPPQTAANNNPFTNGGASQPTVDPFSSQRQISRESVNLGKDMAWTNGRHSPDAFASLSARHG